MTEKKDTSSGSDNRKLAEKIRDKTNGLSDEERFRLLDKGLEIIYGASGRQSTVPSRTWYLRFSWFSGSLHSGLEEIQGIGVSSEGTIPPTPNNYCWVDGTRKRLCSWKAKALFWSIATRKRMGNQAY